MIYKKGDGKLVQGSKSKPSNRMSIPEYDMQSQATRSIGYRPLGSQINSNLQPDFHGVHEIEQKEAQSNDRTSVDIANELTFGSQKKSKKSLSPDRIIKGPSPL